MSLTTIEDFTKLLASIADMQKENKSLKEENKSLKEEIEELKKNKTNTIPWGNIGEEDESNSIKEEDESDSIKEDKSDSKSFAKIVLSNIDSESEAISESETIEIETIEIEQSEVSSDSNIKSVSTEDLYPDRKIYNEYFTNNGKVRYEEVAAQLMSGEFGDEEDVEFGDLVYDGTVEFLSLSYRHKFKNFMVTVNAGEFVAKRFGYGTKFNEKYSDRYYEVRSFIYEVAKFSHRGLRPAMDDYISGNIKTISLPSY